MHAPVTDAGIPTCSCLHAAALVPRLRPAPMSERWTGDVEAAGDPMMDAYHILVLSFSQCFSDFVRGRQARTGMHETACM